ncbi:type II toxin-antitoxin system VapC family toxin [Mesorhizobium sp. CN2-181]|uniref:type II toxin-antitoxin system VapC family toxin n=1 Tax=Mesorhizobium yinganensis TaxID=3157707 RepID=UPI0032B77DD0
MSSYLLHTSVLSLFAPDRPGLPPAFKAWLSTTGRRQTWYVPAIAAVEIQKGVAKFRRAGGTARAARLEQWLEDLLSEFGERVLPIYATTARTAGNMEDSATARGRNPGLSDVLIAATAARHNLVVLTANSRHFEALGIEHFNPLTV